MTSRFYTTLAVIVLALLPLGTAVGDVRDQLACSIFDASAFSDPPRLGSGRGNKCFSGHTCWVGVRGDWLDLTGSTSITSGPRARIRIDKTGVDDSGSPSGDCIPRSNKDREGYVRLILEDIDGTGTMRIHLSRPGGADTISVTVADGTTFVGTRLERAFADTGVPKEFTLTGRNLDRLRLKQDGIRRVGLPTGVATSIEPVQGRASLTEPEAILSQTETTARVRLTFPESGTISLKNKLEFEGGEPPLNALLGWPVVRVSRATAQNPPPQNQPVPGGGGTGTTTTSPLPNLTPQRLFAERPLLRKINTLSSLMIPAFFCSGLGNNEEREVDVPAFEWGVANDNRAGVGQAFSVAVLNGAANNTALTTVNVATIPESDLRSFRNWPGRPPRVRVVKVTGPPLMAEYNNAAGCYIPNALAGRVVLDPRPLVIRVDSGNQITERVENDNDLVIQ